MKGARTKGIKEHTHFFAACDAVAKALWASLTGGVRRGPAPPQGLHLIVGPKRCGKGVLGACLLDDFRRQWGKRIRIVARGLWKGRGEVDGEWTGQEGQILSPMDLLTFAVRDRSRAENPDRRPLVAWIPDASSFLDTQRWQSVDFDMLQFLSLQAHYHTAIFADTQDSDIFMKRARILGDYIWEPRLFFGNRLLVARRYNPGVYLQWRARLVSGTVDNKGKRFKRPKPQLTYWRFVGPDIWNTYDSWEEMLELTDRAEEADPLGEGRRPRAKGGRSRSSTDRVRAYRERKRLGAESA